jgi:hypothetical protein
MLNDYFKNRTVKNVTLIFLLAIAIYAFVEWREQRLERRATMLPQETQLDLSQVSSEGRVEFLIDSNTGRQYVYIDVYTPVEYKEWNDIELEVVVKNKANEKIYVVTNCFPYQYRETTLGLPLRSTCNLGYIPNGLYAANIKVLTSNIEFKENKSNIIFSYSGVGDYPDFFSSVFDSLLDGFVTEIFDSLLQYFSELIGD